MFFKQPLKGENLPDKTVCLTYDDGPGPNTINIARFLHSKNIAATFFVVGKYAFQNEEILKELKNLGHLIGNHTYTHPELRFFTAIDGDVQNEVINTNKIIEKYIDGKTIYFRAPYGSWSCEVANVLNANILSTNNHLGPIHWDIPGNDFYYWQNNFSIEVALNYYVDEIFKLKKGIVVMHDDTADMDQVRPSNKTFELTCKLVEKLKTENFNFIRLDDIENFKQLSQVPLICYLKIKNKFLTVDENLTVRTTKKLSESSAFELINVPGGKIAIKAYNNLYLSSADIEIKGFENLLSEFCHFDLINIKGEKFMLRDFTGKYLALEKSGKLAARNRFFREGDIFYYISDNNAVKKPPKLKEKLMLAIKLLKYIKSKIIDKLLAL